MNVIRRDEYLNKLIEKRENGAIKVITGLRRAGKSFLLFKLFYEYLISTGVDERNIITIALDSDEFEELCDYKELGVYIRERIKDGSDRYYVLLDEVQFCPNFEKVLNGLTRRENVDVYVTGSNSRFLSSDILTEFRGRGDEVRVYPLSFSEFRPCHDGNVYDAFEEYLLYGGMPRLIDIPSSSEKAKYLIGLFNETYIRDVVERHNLRDRVTLDSLVDIIASAVGSITNPTKLSNTFKSVLGKTVSDNTIRSYLEFIEDSFLISTARRYDIKGKKYIGGKAKYFFTDVGLRNARLNFRQHEPAHLQENVIYLELLRRGYSVDVGVETISDKNRDGKYIRRDVEVDFVCNLGSQRIYIQSALTLPDADKVRQETRPLLKIDDNFQKLIITGDRGRSYINESGIRVVPITEFLLDRDSLNNLN